MKPEEAIERLEYLESALDGYPPETGINDVFAAIDTAIEDLKEVQQYREIGTVEECREAVEKQRTKKTHIVTNELLGGTSYVCPNCGAEMMLIDRNRIQWGHMQKYCGCCGQAIDENLEGMEDG